MRKLQTLTGICLALALGVADGGVAMAKGEGDFIMRARGIAFLTDTDGTTDALGGSAETSDDYVPELDFSYFFTDNIAAELILATTKHKVKVENSSAGDVDLGTVWALPPVLTLQYHFMPKDTFSPYLGAGLNYTIMYNADKSAGINDIDYSDGVGYALQAGFDYQLDDHWMINADIKKVFVDTDIKVNGGTINANDTALDPLIVGIGIGYNF
ncbi:OmpW family protein [Rhodospirillaceae bacterium KN72]|uniref:OmpW family protein n=1 Tax=Pacificispira spongiicola TaxID=2729598 RepID=A0A7Y0DWK8_9PROT|nr:OmpW family outer membrane protein [Pacificispira spongiicola]NMM42927.1 OmpW family protein [Pacificispira spongiicola]